MVASVVPDDVIDPTVNSTAVDPAPYAGRFCSAETGTCLSFRARDGRLVYSGPRWADQMLTPAYRDVFTGAAAPRASRIVVKFQRDAAGAVW